MSEESHENTDRSAVAGRVERLVSSFEDERDGHEILMVWETPSCKRAIGDDTADAYIVVKLPEQYTGGVMIYGLYHNEWHPNPSGRPVVSKLLQENSILRHGLEQISNDKDNPEGWASDKQIADHYLNLANV